MTQTKRNIKAIFDAFTKWNDIPDWMFGGDTSTFYRDTGGARYTGKVQKAHDTLNAVSDVVMYPFQLFERYWKKVIAQSSGAFAMTHLNKIGKE